MSAIIMYDKDAMGSTVGRCPCGTKVAAVWGPTIDGGWCVAVQGRATQKLPTEDEALSLLPVQWPVTPPAEPGHVSD